MKIRPHIIAVVVSAALASAVNSARADDAMALTHEIVVMDAAASSHGSNTVTNKIAGDFESFAGSSKNATALVTGLREGSEITLVQRGQRSATFTPATGKMGYGNVSTSLALAQYQLAQQGITNPTPLQLKAALNGGTIIVNGKPVTFDGVLQMRADGLGWGQIAQQLGTKLGPVVSGIKAQNTHIAATPRAAVPVTAGAPTAGSAAAATQPRSSAAQGAGKGIVNAEGGSAAVTAKGKNDAGASTATGRPSQPGRGVVTAGGQSVVTGTAQGNAYGHGASTAAGTAAGSGAVSAAGNASGGGSGQGKALGHSK